MPQPGSCASWLFERARWDERWFLAAVLRLLCSAGLQGPDPRSLGLEIEEHRACDAQTPHCCLSCTNEGTNGLTFAAKESNPLPRTLGHPGTPSWEAHGQRHVGCGCSIPRYRVSLRDAAVQTDKTLGSPSCNASGHPRCRQAHRLAAI